MLKTFLGVLPDVGLPDVGEGEEEEEEKQGINTRESFLFAGRSRAISAPPR